MDASRYDEMTKTFARRLSRRRVLAALFGVTVTAPISASGISAQRSPCVPGGACQRSRDCCPSEQCIAGICGGRSSGPSCRATGCPPSTVPCHTNRCNQGTGQCELVPDSALDGTACDDGNACTGPDTCTQGVCSGPQITCDDGNACTTNSCNPTSGCVYTAITCNTPPDACHTSPGACSGGVCSYSAVRCPACAPCSNGQCVPNAAACADPNECTLDICDPVDGCLHPPVEDDTACAFGTCQGGICTPVCAGEYEPCHGVACCEGFCVTNVPFVPHICCGRAGANCKDPGGLPLESDDVCCSRDCRDGVCQ
jgi:Dictyostelium (slime mold) repeat